MHFSDKNGIFLKNSFYSKFISDQKYIIYIFKKNFFLLKLWFSNFHRIQPSYENALEMLNMDTLYDRRETKCLKFAKGCLSEKEMRKMFPLNISRKKYEKFKVNHARTSRYQKSSIIYMQKLLNNDSDRQKKITRSMNAACSREERLQNSSLSLWN